MIIIHQAPAAPGSAEAGRIVVTGIGETPRPAEIVHHPADIVHHEAVLDDAGEIVAPAHDETIADAYDETVTPAETEAEFEARMVAAHVPAGAPHVVLPAVLTDAPPERWQVDWQTGVIAVLPAQPSESDYAAAVQARIDAAARARGYADGVALASYATSTVPAWNAEAGAFVAWRDAVWSYAFAQLAAVEAQQRSQPSVAELVGELPAMTWPR